MNSAAPRVARRCVLVVDDNRDAANTLAAIIRLAGHQVHTCYDGAAGFREACRLRPDVLFLDLGLPGMDGYEVAALLKKERGLESMRMVAVTGYGQGADRERALAAGFDHHLLKPPDPSVIRAIVDSQA